jgi:hypothetical protein
MAANPERSDDAGRAIYANTNPLLATADQSLRGAMRPESAVTRSSDHGPRKFYDLDNQHPIQPRKKMSSIGAEFKPRIVLP